MRNLLNLSLLKHKISFLNSEIRIWPDDLYGPLNYDTFGVAMCKEKKKHTVNIEWGLERTIQN